ncbi:MAG: outer membrane protein assembly factor BamE [Candidatus Dactylopiibacterium sp.]|nr:outer membrane protein assembly factor BamE [Candidatus Dactylopiibacterium sp.]
MPELIRELGQPSMIWSEGDGTLLVEFARIQHGGSNFIARVGRDGVLQNLQEALTDARVAMLLPGMTRDEVRRHLGQPSSTEVTAATEIWRWPLDSRTPAQWQVEAHFGARGKLEQVARTRIAPPRIPGLAARSAIQKDATQL